MDGDIANGRASQRAGTGDRHAAIGALGQHTRAGRLSTQEYEDRSEIAKQAVTLGDIDALFADLPEPHPTLGAVTDQISSATDAAGAARQGLVPQPLGAWLVRIAPVVAVILFFLTWQWWVFFMIPVIGMLVHGPHEKHHR